MGPSSMVHKNLAGLSPDDPFKKNVLLEGVGGRGGSLKIIEEGRWTFRLGFHAQKNK